MPKAIVVREPGDINVLKLEEIPEPKAPGPGQVLVRHTAIGVNYIDTYYRTGVYKSKLPMVPGSEATGIVEAVGEGVDIPIGERVMYANAQTGAYCEKRLINQNLLLGIPKEIDDVTAASILSKGLTAHYLLFRTYRVGKKDTILIHAAAGGVGRILCQWAKWKGATVIGTVGSDAKAQIAKKSGCDYVINYTKQDFVEEVLRITNGNGVPVVYDSVGKDTFAKSLQCLRPLGLMVSFGQSSGPVPPINILSLAQRSLFLTRPTLTTYKSSRKELILTGVELFEMIKQGVVTPSVFKTYPLEKAAEAHKDLESRSTTGSLVLTV